MTNSDRLADIRKACRDLNAEPTHPFAPVRLANQWPLIERMADLCEATDALLKTDKEYFGGMRGHHEWEQSWSVLVQAADDFEQARRK